MNTLARVIRSESAAALVPFQPGELGSKAELAGTHTFQFPAAEKIPEVVHDAGTHSFAPPEIEELAAIPVLEDDEESESGRVGAMQHAFRDQALRDARSAAEAEMNEHVGALREKLADTVARLSELASSLPKQMEQDAVGLAIEIAKKIVGHEVSVDHEVVTMVAKNALSKLHSRTLATIHLNFDDLAYVQAHRDKLNFHGSLEFVEDNSITPGGCLIHTESGDVDGRIESQFDEIQFGLLGNDTE
jgi:flagellar assembly protein FliH